METDKPVTGLKGKSFLDAGYVYAPYVPLMTTPVVLDPKDVAPRSDIMTRYANKVVNPSFVGVALPQVRGKAIYDDPIKKIKHEMGYDVEPDRYESGFQLLSSELVSVQPMTKPSGTVFHFDYKFQPPTPAEYVDIKFTITPDGAIFNDTEKK